MIPNSEKKGLRSKANEWIPVLRTVSVEPASFLMMGSILCTYLTYQDFLFHKICRIDLNYDEDVCIEISALNKTYASEETEIQKIAASIRSHVSIIDHSIPILFVLFMGPWSDIHGRKFPMLLAVCTSIVKPLALIACVYMDDLSGRWTAYIVSGVRSLCGGETLFMMAAYSYISDTTDKSVRTIRTGLLSAGYTLGVPFGFALGGALTRAKIGFSTSFAISTCISTAAFLVILFTVKNKKKLQEELEKGGKTEKTVDDNKDMNIFKKTIISSLTQAKGFFALIFKKRENSGRLKICLLLLVNICVAAPIHGEFGVMYLFLRNRLQWDAGAYGYFAMYNTLCGVTGVVLSMGILSYLLKLSDPVVGFLAGISQFGGCIVYAIAHTAWMMYLAPTVDMMNGTMYVIARSMMSKIVLPDEVGKLFSIVAVIDSLVPLGMDPTYSTLYRLTVDTFSGSFWILSAALTVPPQIIYTWLIWRSRSEKSIHLPKPSEEQLEKGKSYPDGITNHGFSVEDIPEQTAAMP